MGSTASRSMLPTTRACFGLYPWLWRSPFLWPMLQERNSPRRSATRVDAPSCESQREGVLHTRYPLVPSAHQIGSFSEPQTVPSRGVGLAGGVTVRLARHRRVQML